MKQLTLVEKGKIPDCDASFCRFRDDQKKEITVIVPGPQFSEFEREFQCDLEKLCRYAAEKALKAGVEGDFHIEGPTYLAIRKRLRSEVQSHT